MPHVLDAASLDQLFRTARTYNAFSGEVSDDTLRQALRKQLYPEENQG